MTNNAVKNTTQPKPSQLVGRYFLGAIPSVVGGASGNWMGYVRSVEADGLVYLDVYDWLIGAYSHSTLVHIRDMAGWKFLNDKGDLFNEARLHMRRLEASEGARTTPIQEDRP